MKGKKEDSTWRMAGVASAVGFEILAFIMIGAFAGKYAGSQWGRERLWVPVGALAGFLFGVFSCYMTLRTFIHKK